MRDLAASMALSAPSLYNAFGDSRHFCSALERYLDCTARVAAETLKSSHW